MKKSLLLRGAISLATGSFLVKVLGVIYRIPLTNLLGGVGLGLYQMIFPVYTLLLDFAGAGIPSAISKIVGEEDASIRQKIGVAYLKSALKRLSVIGAVGCLIMITLCYPISVLQGNSGSVLGYIMLAPSVFIVSLISCFRGYFQGQMQMNPTSISQVVEQGVKLVLGIILVKAFMPNVNLAVGGATLAVTISEVVALIYLWVLYKKSVKGLKNEEEIVLSKPQTKKLFRIAVPITLLGILLPLSHFIDSFLIVNLLKHYRADATSLYGLLSGVVHTVIGLPIGLCYAVAVVSIPTVSAETDLEQKKQRIGQAVFLTGIVSFVFAGLTYLFADPIINTLFRSLSVEEKTVAVNLLRLTSPVVLLLSVLQTTNSCLVGLGKTYLPLFSLGGGIVVKTLISLFLIPNERFNIYGGSIALIACYFFAVMVNFIVLLKVGEKNADKAYKGRKCQTF